MHPHGLLPSQRFILCWFIFYAFLRNIKHFWSMLPLFSYVSNHMRRIFFLYYYGIGCFPPLQSCCIWILCSIDYAKRVFQNQYLYKETLPSVFSYFEVCISYNMLSNIYEFNNTTIYSSTLNFVVLNRKWIIPKAS